MRYLPALLFVACALTCCWADVITPDPVTVRPVTINPERPLPSVVNLLEKFGIRDSQGMLLRVFKFFMDPSLRNESASAYNGIRQALVDAYSCFRQKLRSEMQEQEGIVANIVDAMHKVTAPEPSPNQYASDDILSIMKPELDILMQIWNNPEFQGAYVQLRLSLMTSGQAGLTCLRERLKTIRGDVELILGNAIQTFRATTVAPTFTTTPTA